MCNQTDIMVYIDFLNLSMILVGVVYNCMLDLSFPDFAKENELLGLAKGWDVCGSDDGLCAARERALKQNMENGSDQELQEEVENNEEQVNDEGKLKRKRKTALLEKVRQQK